MLGKAADALRPLTGRISGAWRQISLPNRRRIAVAGTAIALVILIRALIVPALPCSFPGGDECEPAREDALALVPADAVSYVHADLDTSSDQYAKAVGIAAETPKLTQQIAGIVLSQFLGAAGKPSDFSNGIRPWFGGELLIAQLAPADGAGQVQMLQIQDERGAADYAKSIATVNPQSSVYRGTSVTVDARGLASAIVDDFLVIGREAGVRSVIDVSTGADGAKPITDDETESQVRDELPDDAVVEAYVGGEGVPQLFGKGGPLAAAAPLVDASRSKGMGAAVVATDDGLELSTRSVLDPDAPEAGPFAALPELEGDLADRVQGDALAFLGFGDPGETLQGLLKGAGRRADGLLGFAGVLRGLGKAGEVDLADELLPALGDEAAFALIPRASAAETGGEDLPGEADPAETLAPDSGVAPYIELLSDVSDEEAATAALKELQPALADELGAKGKGRFSDTRIGGVVAPVLRLSPAAEVAYSVFDSLFVFSTDPDGVRAIADSDGDPLADSDLFQRSTDDLGDGRSLLAYFDVGGLLRFAEANGQAANPAYATFADDLRKIEALSVSVSSSDDELGTDSRLLVGGEAPAQTGSD